LSCRDDAAASTANSTIGAAKGCQSLLGARNTSEFGATVEKFMDDHPEWYLSTMKGLFPGRKATG
jgi:hypothetical protein